MPDSLCKCSGFTCAGGGAVKATSGRTVSGYAVRWREGPVPIRRGAFADSLKGPSRQRIWHLDQGDPIRRVGRPTLLEERAAGLYFETRIPETTLGDELLALYREGAMGEHTVLMSDVDYDAAGVVTKARLWAVTTVTWSDRGTAQQQGKTVKELRKTAEQLAGLQRALESGRLSPERAKEVAAQLGMDPPNDTDSPNEPDSPNEAPMSWLAPRRRYHVGSDPDRKHNVRRGW